MWYHSKRRESLFRLAFLACVTLASCVALLLCHLSFHRISSPAAAGSAGHSDAQRLLMTSDTVARIGSFPNSQKLMEDRKMREVLFNEDNRCQRQYSLSLKIRHTAQWTTSRFFSGFQLRCTSEAQQQVGLEKSARAGEPWRTNDTLC